MFFLKKLLLLEKYQSQKIILALSLVLILTFVAFWPSLFNGFTVWDDDIHLVENETIRHLSWSTLKTIFTTDVSLTYIPLTSLSFAIEHHFFGYAPFVYHLNNLLLHLATTALVFILAQRMTSSIIAAMGASLIFGIHPMHVESVAWITERKDVLYSVFYMLALIFYWDYRERKQSVFYGGSLLCGLLSILAKAMALSLPLALLALDYFQRRKIDRKLFLDKIPYLAYIVPIAWWTYSLNARIVDLRFPESVLIWVWTLVFYLRKFFWPFDFLPLYELPQPITLLNPVYLLSIVLLLAIGTLMICFRKNRSLVFAVLYYMVSIFFLLRFDDKADLCIVADRFMYLPSLGLCIYLGLCLKQSVDWLKTIDKIVQSGLVLSVGVVVIFLMISTFQQNRIWGNPLIFWGKVLAKYPHNPQAFNQRGLEYRTRGELKSAFDDFSQAIILNPGYDFAFTNRGAVLKDMGYYQEALSDHSQAIALNPDFSEAYLNRGNVYFQLAQFEEAIKDYNKAILTRPISARRNSTPYFAEVFSRRGSAYFFAKQHDLALQDLNQALKIDSNNIVALDNRAIIYSLRSQNDLALKDYNRSLVLAPHNPVSYTNRALLFHLQGDDVAALRDLDMALVVAPDYKRAVQLKQQITKK